MEDETDGIHVMIDYNQEINIVRFLGNSVAPCRINLRAEVLLLEESSEIDSDIAFAKIKFWFETIISRTIVFSRNNATAVEMLLNSEGKPRLTNHLMITPYEPNDEHLAMLFQAKMTALANKKLGFGCIRVEASTSNGLVFTYVGDSEKDLPSMEDWFDTKPYYFDTPWWNRDDVSTIDMIYGEPDLTQTPPWAFKLDFIEKSLRPNQSAIGSEDEDTTSENVIIKGAFKPKVIDGGLDEDES